MDVRNTFIQMEYVYTHTPREIEQQRVISYAYIPSVATKYIKDLWKHLLRPAFTFYVM